MDYRNQSLGALAIAIPRASVCFASISWISAAAAGNRWHAAERRRLDIDRLENELAATAATPEPSRDWRTAPLGEVIDYILPRFHQRHREQLAELVLMAERSNACTATSPAARAGWRSS